MNAFCPTCANLLTIDYPDEAYLLYRCETCPYIYEVDHKTVKSARLTKKKLDHVTGGEEEWKNAAKDLTSQCPKCSQKGAYFKEVQTRSADEPATLFFRCMACGHYYNQR